MPGIEPGLYVCAIQLWKLGANSGQEQLVYSAARWPTEDRLAPEDAERLINLTIGKARLWHEAPKLAYLRSLSLCLSTGISLNGTFDLVGARTLQRLQYLYVAR